MMRLICILLLVVLCAPLKAQLHWESVILEGNDWKYLEATSEPPAEWNIPGFDDAGWASGPGGIGYGDGDDATVTAEALNSLYLRKSFTVAADTTFHRLILDVDYDDAFVAYLNGTEIARSFNVTEEDPSYDSQLTVDREARVKDGGERERYFPDPSLVVTGENLLAVHIINNGTGSSDLSSLVNLHGELHGTGTTYQQLPAWFSEPVDAASSNLPLVVINTGGQDIPDEPKITAQMGIINHSPGQRNSLDDPYNVYDGYIGIETRGQSTQMFPKKSYSLETRDAAGENLNVSLLGMPAENDWILYAPYSDKSMLRNAVTFELGRSLDEYCSRTAFCEVYIDGDYRGVYILMEKIKRDDDRVDIDPVWPYDLSGDELTGGYIFRVDKTDDGYTEGYTGFTSRPEPSYPNAKDIIYQYYDPGPDELAVEQKEYLKDAIIQAEEILISPEFDDPEIGYNYCLNTSSFVDFMLINEISKEVDKYRYSSYFYKKKESNGGEIHAGPIWDFNLGYANVDYWDFGLSTSGWLFADVQPVEWSIIFWWKRLMEDPFFVELVRTRWQYLRQDAFSDAAVSNLIDSLTMLIDEAKDRNYARWPILGTYVWPNHDWQGNDYADEVDFFSSWLFDRLHWMDGAFAGSVLEPSASLQPYGFNGTTYSCMVSVEQDYFTHRRPKPSDFQIIDEAGLQVVASEYVDASTVKLTIDASGNTIPDETVLSVRVEHDVLNGFRSLQTNQVIVGADENVSMRESVKIYAHNGVLFITLLSPGSQAKYMEIYTLAGRNVFNQQLDPAAVRTEIPLDLPEGIYLVRIMGAHRVYTQKVPFSR